ncbi:S-adenosyl-L-methionine-dependent methyltransferase [Quillaja saponaria]|uniref:S-adenosyl-L-methionine-dependent methyltransferase n=1 Tax=Quillaja saponaria TaxID=32244 RepID=A0AAD7PNR4_QUISA|nr:S-adenosyl-L-methionine-dependent methyltransferase [Quillaja saponaria]
MEWSATSATRAYLDTLKLCNSVKRQSGSWRSPEPGSNEFVSALAAGMRAKLIVEVTSGVSPSTVALAAAARQTGGRLVCILPELILAESKRVIKDSGLKDLVEFKTGDPSELLPNYANIDFSLVDCKNDDYTRLLNLLDVNTTRSVVVANNLVGERKGLGGHLKGKDEEKVTVRSLKHPIGKGMEVTMIGKNDEIEKRNWGGGGHSGIRRSKSLRDLGKSKWVVKFDKESGEEHIYRVPKLVG